MTDTSPPPAESGAEARIVVTGPEDVTQRALDQVAERENALNLDAPSEPSEEPSPESSTEENGELEPDDKKGKPPKGVQKRLDELTKDKYDQQRRAEAAEARLEKALAALERGGQPQEPQQSFVDPRLPPNPANYREGELDVDFIRDTSRFVVQQEIQAVRAEAERTRVASEIEQRENVARAKYEDYNDVVTPQNLAPILQNQDLFRHLATHENGPELSYYLAKNPEEVMTLARMDPFAAGQRLGKLLELISPPESKTEVRTSKAPAPIAPIRGSGAAPAVNYEQQMQEALDSGNYDRWRALKRARAGGK